MSSHDSILVGLQEDEPAEVFDAADRTCAHLPGAFEEGSLITPTQELP
jgi:hypothetical protein